ncbi:carbohydrate ABC transporter permease [Halorussus salinisoli]|uniref:carbohydrate ABC transporter permease n=1 Tax=Halorussus salinisoli TaxID=2558242 RepID=UPI002A908C5F|nr:carbohydrate ABC transporter permease [Halorussus salinisoli]
MSSRSEDDSAFPFPSANRIALYAALVVMAAFYLGPLESGLMTALKSQEAFYETSPFVPPFGGAVTFRPWIEAFGQLEHALVNSLLFTVPATLLSAVIGSLAAYGLTGVNWRGQVAVLLLFVAGIFIPYQSVLVPLTRFWTIVDVSELLAAIPPLAERPGIIELIFTHTAYGIPITTLLFRAHYKSLSESMLEAARLDGASVSRIYLRIVLPLSVPMFIVALIYQFTNIWNDLLFALVLVSNPGNEAVTIALSKLKGSMVQQFNLQMAGAFITAFPTLVVYILFGEQFAEGVEGGGT